MSEQIGINSVMGRDMFLHASEIVCGYCPGESQGLCGTCGLRKVIDELKPLPKKQMQLIWHNCKICPPSEAYNECLYLWNGERVVQAEWYHDAWHYEDDLCDDIMIASEDAEHMWWADLHQTAGCFFKEACKA